MKESTNITVTGRITDRIIHLDTGEVEVRKGHNLVVTSFTKLVMALVGRATNYKGINYWAVGSGLTEWDNNPVSPTLNETTLTAELGRKLLKPENFSFQDAEGNTSQTPTNILRVNVTFEADECNGIWREFGLFGGNATATLNSGILVDKRHHEVITKTNTMAIERTIVFTLNLN